MNHPLYHLVLARLRELYREPGVLFWVFGFPLLLAICLGIAFRDKPPAPSPIGVDMRLAGADQLVAQMNADPLIRATPVQADWEQALIRGDVLVLVLQGPSGPELIYDPAREGALLAKVLAERHLQNPDAQLVSVPERFLSEPGSRYIDFLLPGLLGVNLMSSSLWGIGWAIVQARGRKQLKRLAATPMLRTHYMTSQLLARAVLMLVEVTVLVLFGEWVFSIPMRGSWLDLMLVSFVGTGCFAGIACLLATRTERNEVISGLMNLVMLPMYVLSGVFFSKANFPDFLQPIINLLPLTMLNDALRGILLEGDSFWVYWPQMAGLLVVGLISFALALRFFRWK